MVDEMAEFGSQWLGISGGEPLLRPDVWEVIEYAEKKHDMKVSLITSGLHGTKKFRQIKQIPSSHRNQHRGDKESNEIIRRKGGYDKALHAMEKLSSVGLLDCIVTTMTKHNIKHMAHPAALAEEYKARMVVYHNLVPVGRAANTWPT